MNEWRIYTVPLYISFLFFYSLSRPNQSILPMKNKSLLNRGIIEKKKITHQPTKITHSLRTIEKERFMKLS